MTNNLDYDRIFFNALNEKNKTMYRILDKTYWCVYEVYQGQILRSEY